MTKRSIAILALLMLTILGGVASATGFYDNQGNWWNNVFDFFQYYGYQYVDLGGFGYFDNGGDYVYWYWGENDPMNGWVSTVSSGNYIGDSGLYSGNSYYDDSALEEYKEEWNNYVDQENDWSIEHGVTPMLHGY